MEEVHDKDFGTLRLQGPAVYEAGVRIFQWMHWICSGTWDALVFMKLCCTCLKHSLVKSLVCACFCNGE